jgi:hypothetical protein
MFLFAVLSSAPTTTSMARSLGDISNDVGGVKDTFSVQAAGAGSHKPRVGGGGRA